MKYKGYVEAILGLSQVKNFEEPSLFVVVNNGEYSKRLPIQLGTLHIDMVLEKATKQELAALGKTWKRGKLNQPKGKSGEFSLEQVDGTVKTAEAIVIQPGETKKISGLASFKGNSKRINVFTGPLEKTLLEEEPTWTTVPSFFECKSGSWKVIVMAKGQHIAQVLAANQVPNMLAPKYIDRILKYDMEKASKESSFKRQQNDPKCVKKLWEQLDVTGGQILIHGQKIRKEKYDEPLKITTMSLHCTL